MRPYKKQNVASVPEEYARGILAKHERWIRWADDALSRISSGQVPSQGGGLIAVTDHGALSGLGDDDHAQYLLLAGRVGGQTAWGGTSAALYLATPYTNDLLTLGPTSGVDDELLRLYGNAGADRVLLTSNHSLLLRGWIGRTGFNAPTGSKITTSDPLGHAAVIIQGIPALNNGALAPALWVTHADTSEGGNSTALLARFGLISSQTEAFKIDAGGKIAGPGSLNPNWANYNATFMNPSAPGLGTDAGVLYMRGQFASNQYDFIRVVVSETSGVYKNVFHLDGRGRLTLTSEATTHVAAGQVPLTLRSDGVSTAHLTEWYDAAAALALYVDKDGVLNGDGSGLTGVVPASHTHPESDITDGSILARVAADETISGDWTFTGYPVFEGGSGGILALFDVDTAGGNMPFFGTSSTYSYNWATVLDTVGTGFLTLALDGAPGFATLTFPVAGGNVMTTVSADTVSNKTMNTLNKFIVGSVGACVMQQTFATTKQAYFSLANITAGNTRVYSGLDFNGNLLLGVGGVDRTTTVGTTTLLANTAVAGRMVRVDIYAECTNGGSGTLDVTIGWTSNGNAKTEAVLASHGHGSGTGALDLSSTNNWAHGAIVVFADASTNVTYTVVKTGGGTGETFRVIVGPSVY